MVDAADRDKVEASRNELHNLLDKPQLQGIPVSPILHFSQLKQMFRILPPAKFLIFKTLYFRYWYLVTKGIYLMHWMKNSLLKKCKYKIDFFLFWTSFNVGFVYTFSGHLGSLRSVFINTDTKCKPFVGYAVTECSLVSWAVCLYSTIHSVSEKSIGYTTVMLGLLKKTVSQVRTIF